MTRANNKGKAQVDKARAMHALSCLLQLVITARQQTDIATWQRVGGLEAEDFLDAIESGGLHPLAQYYEARKADGGRAGPGLRERHFRRLAVLLSVALQRSSLSAEQARTKAAEALTGLLRTTPTKRSIEGWELKLEPPLSPDDEEVIAAAMARCGNDEAALIRHFRGFVRFPHLTDSAEGWPLLRDRNMPQT
jgi:hypothetical protein